MFTRRVCVIHMVAEVYVVGKVRACTSLPEPAQTCTRLRTRLRTACLYLADIRLYRRGLTAALR